MSGAGNKAVFLSYASQDAEAAKRICEALRAAGVEVWFDQNELVGGDAWDAKIRKQIAECALFVPIISANTQARLEGYFRIEWKLAAQRTHAMAEEKAFLLPVVLDEIRDAEAKVPGEFKAVQWSRIGSVESLGAFCARVRKLLGGSAAVGAALRRDSLSESRREAAPTVRTAPYRRWLIPALAVCVVVIALGVWRPWQQGGPPPGTGATAGADKSVAVLAFTNLSEDKSIESFADGISVELQERLGSVGGLKVAAQRSAFHFKGSNAPIPEIARQLGVAYVVDGTVRRAGSEVRIAAQLIKAADGFRVWGDTFKREVKDLFAVQDEIAGLVAKNLELKLGERVGPAREIAPEAYQEYLSGRAEAAKAGMEDLRRAVTHFERAVAREPAFAAAWVQLAGAHTLLGRWGGSPTREAWPAARTAINRARALEPDSPDMLLAHSWILRTADWDWRGAEQALRRAMALRPNHPDTLSAAAVLLFNIGKQEEAFRLGRQAARLDPLNAATQIDLSLMFFFSDNWAEAERAARRALQLSPTGSGYHAILAWSLIAQKRFAEGEAELALDHSEVERINGLGMLALARGQTSGARDCLAKLEAHARTNRDWADLQQSIAWICAGLGEIDRAFAALDNARASRDPSVAWSRTMWPLRPLHADARWGEFLRQIGLADDQLK